MKEKILPQIRLKYFGADKDGNMPQAPPFRCFFCRQKRTRHGGVRDAYTKRPKIICEECAIDQFQHNYGYRSRAAAAARRRRIFDVCYLFQEMVINEYLCQKRLSSIGDISEELFNRLFVLANDIFNGKYSKESKIKFEETDLQEDIEREYKVEINNIRFDWK